MSMTRGSDARLPEEGPTERPNENPAPSSVGFILGSLLFLLLSTCSVPYLIFDFWGSWPVALPLSLGSLFGLYWIVRARRLRRQRNLKPGQESRGNGRD